MDSAPFTSSRPALRLTLRSPRLAPDSYFTDGVRLLRVAHAAAGHGFASLEDCRTLEVRPYSLGELAKLRLRPVVPLP